jgi:hypothetical protein
LALGTLKSAIIKYRNDLAKQQLDQDTAS